MNYPKITVVTPSFNQAEYLEQTILSVLNQNYPNLEYIIIDGGSSDHSVEIIKKYEKQLTYWVSEKDKGLYDGVQKGFDRSSGEIMCWINSDDVFHPGSLFTVGEIFSTLTTVDWIQGIPSVIDEEGRTVLVKNFRNWSKYEFWLGDNEHIQQESSFWRRSLWDKAGGKLNVTLKLAGDYDLWMRFFDFSQLHCVRTILGAFRIRRKNQLSLERMDEYKKEMNTILANHNSELAPADAKRIAQINQLRKSLQNNPFRKKRNGLKYEALFEFPSPISFDRKNNKFRLGDIQPRKQTGIAADQ